MKIFPYLAAKAICPFVRIMGSEWGKRWCRTVIPLSRAEVALQFLLTDAWWWGFSRVPFSSVCASIVINQLSEMLLRGANVSIGPQFSLAVSYWYTTNGNPLIVFSCRTSTSPVAVLPPLKGELVCCYKRGGHAALEELKFKKWGSQKLSALAMRSGGGFAGFGYFSGGFFGFEFAAWVNFCLNTILEESSIDLQQHESEVIQRHTCVCI